MTLEERTEVARTILDIVNFGMSSFTFSLNDLRDYIEASLKDEYKAVSQRVGQLTYELIHIRSLNMHEFTEELNSVLYVKVSASSFTNIDSTTNRFTNARQRIKEYRNA